MEKKKKKQYSYRPAPQIVDLFEFLASRFSNFGPHDFLDIAVKDLLIKCLDVLEPPDCKLSEAETLGATPALGNKVNKYMKRGYDEEIEALFEHLLPEYRSDLDPAGVEQLKDWDKKKA